MARMTPYHKPGVGVELSLGMGLKEWEGGLEGRGGRAGGTGIDHTHCSTLAGFSSLCPNPKPLGHHVPLLIISQS